LAVFAPSQSRKAKRLNPVNTCIYSKSQFDRATAEHILQNFLGARWTSSTIACDEVQATFGKTIDAQFAEALKAFRTILGTKGGRGDVPPTLKGLQTADGQRIDIQPGLKPRLAKPHVTFENKSAEEVKISVLLGNENQAGWAIAELKKKFPKLSIKPEELLKAGRAQESYLQTPVKIEITLGGTDYIRAATKACFNLLAAHNIQVLDPAFDPAREFILHGRGLTEDFFRWPAQLIMNAPKIGMVDHFIGVLNKGASVEAVMNLFGGIPHSFRLSSSYSGPNFKVGYLVDPLRVAQPAETRSPQFLDGAILDFQAQPEKPGQFTLDAAKAAFDTVMKAYQQLNISRILKESWEEVFGPPDGRQITQADVDLLTEKIVKKLFRIDG
jgi:hypothetical protein